MVSIVHERTRAASLSKRYLLLGGSSAILGVAALLAPGVASADDQPPPVVAQNTDQALAGGDDAASGVQEITVTARRRAEKAQEVPIALSVLGKMQLEQSDAYSARDLTELVPDALVTFPNARNVSFNIRGLGTSSANDGLQAAVGIFLDGVYLGRPSLALANLVDLDRIEVLRGPQGTLFGKNTSAGAIAFYTRPPSFTPEASADFEIGDYDYYTVRGTVGGGLIDDVLAAKLSAYKEYSSGWEKNVRTGENKNGLQHAGVRADFLYTPSEDFRLRVIGTLDHGSDTGVVNNFTTYGPVINGTTLFAQRAARLGYTPLPINPSARETDQDTSQRVNTSLMGVTAQADWDVLGHTLTSITGYRTWQFSPINDADQIGLPIVTQSAALSHQRQFSQEFRVASPTEQTISYVGGFYFFFQDLNDHNTTTYGAAAGPWYSAAFSPSALDHVNRLVHSDIKTRSYAGFGQATWHIDDDWSLTGGIRFTRELQIGALTAVEAGGAPAATPAVQAFRDALLAPGILPRTVVNGGEVSGMVTLSYKISPDIMAYATYSNGGKSGGINLNVLPPDVSAKVLPETTDDYEVGLKTTLFDHRLLFNVALYDEIVRNYQTSVIDLNAFTSTLTNAGDVEARGIELDAEARPFDDLDLNAGFALNDAKYLSFHNAPCPLSTTLRLGVTNTAVSCDLTGHTIANAPRYSFNLGTTYTRPLGIGDLDGYIHLEYSYKSQYYNQVDNAPEELIHGYGVANLRVGIHPDADSWNVELWVKNLFNQVYFNTLSPQATNSGAYDGLLGDPRTIGGTVHISF